MPLQRIAVALLLALGAVAACGEDTETVTVPESRIVIAGDYAVEVGATIELTAESRGADDAAYTWATSDSTIATVSEDGVVTGVAKGVVMISATGVDSGLVAERGVVVTAEGGPVTGEIVVRITGDTAVQVGQTLTLTAETINGEDATYSWTSSDDSIATVDSGVVTAIAAGVATITATGSDTGKTADHGVVVTTDAPIAEAVVLVSGAAFVKPNETIQLTAQTVNGEDAAYTWTSSDEAIATVDSKGLVTGIADGEAIITATGSDTGVEGLHAVVVRTDAEPGTPVVVVAGDASLAVGETLTLNVATVNGDDSTYTWTSSDEAVATVTGGVVTGVSAGVALITAKGDTTGAEGSHGIVVLADPIPAVPSVSVVGDFLIDVGSTVVLTASTTNGTDASYAWASSDEAVATVDATGTVIGVAQGETVISATGADTGAVGLLGVVVVGEAPFEPPFFADWKGSGHADSTAEAFIHWNAEGAVPASCAKCHSSGGFKDFIGEDGSAFGSVESPAALGTTVECSTCHNAATMQLSEVTFPSGVTVENLGPEARCMTCHQGRSSTVSVDDKITTAAVASVDEISTALSFQNIHYFAAGATLYGGEAMGAYQYDGAVYDQKNHHVDGYDTCTDCHNPHTLQVKVTECAGCHTGVETVEDLAEVRMFGTTGDYDGDGDTVEGMKAELDGLADTLYAAIQAYATEVAGSSIVYDSHTYPYFFADANSNGAVDEGEGKYVSWTARLVKAAYNYQYYLKDPGAFAHNPKYLVEVMHDSINDLNAALTVPVAFAGERSDGGHFDGSGEPFRHWDEDGEVSASCSKCHGGAEGFRFYVEHGVSAAVEPANGMKCVTCHTDVPGFGLVEVADVTFPSGEVMDFGAKDNICATCHSGREAMATVDAAIAANKLGFKNVHYLPAAAVLAGTEAKVGYEIGGKTYAGKWAHYGGEGAASCTFCHGPVATSHSFDVADNVDSCKGCHGSTDIATYRLPPNVDHDGDGNASEPLGGELEGLGEALYAQMQAVATAAGKPLAYDGHSYPYFFADTNGNGVVDPDEAVGSNGYKGWTADLMKAAFNFQLYHKEPGAWAHNFPYVAQLLIDSTELLGGDVSTFSRP